eukprot:CAMPEP_0170361932 /NCGR_PEP_ID=MMETSP0117_2-20130122/4064_1 /TAXON_ID=400756 /ORGANISM="Durinskia baltica, Strain CSIRO CS-38" /LENGTH=44 /DNA_ID= /DNA_START= /DNA_END= /DNA_ORIENTATION=
MPTIAVHLPTRRWPLNTADGSAAEFKLAGKTVASERHACKKEEP